MADPMGTGHHDTLLWMLEEQAQVHVKNGACAGLPYCVSCRASALLNNDLDTTVSEAWINAQEAGTVVYRNRR